MAIQIISKLTQKNGMSFKIVDAVNVSYDGTETISIKDKIDAKPDFVISDIEPTDQKNGDIWMESI